MERKVLFRSKRKFRLTYVSILAALVGVGAAGLAYLIYHFIGFMFNLFFWQQIGFDFNEPPHSGLPWWIIFIPVIGGLVCGLLAKYGTKQIIGHGIPEAMEAVWRKKSKVNIRVLFLKPISAAIAIGTGAPFGVEGPIIQGGGALGSVVGQWISTTATERKVLLACGAAAGMAASFNTPIAAVLIAIELLVFEFKTRSFIPITIASLFATGLRRIIISSKPMFDMPDIHLVPSAFFTHLPFLIGLGIIIGLVGIIFNRGYFKVANFLHKTPLNDVLLPGFGGLILGVMGYFVPRTFGVGYSVIREILNNEIPWLIILLVMVFKVVGVYVTLGTKTSGGFLAPVFIAGAALGSLYAYGINFLFPGLALPVSLFALCGLGTLFGVVSNATFGFTLFAIEVTGQYEALLPVLFVAVVSDTIASLFMKKNIMTRELSERGVDITQGYEVNVLDRYECGDVMKTNNLTIPKNVTIAQLAVFITEHQRLAQQVPATTLKQLNQYVEKFTTTKLPEIQIDGKTINNDYPIEDDKGNLLGIITYGDIIKAITLGKEGATVEEFCSKDLIKAYPEEKLFDLVVRMSESNIDLLPVVSHDDEDKMIGLLGRHSLISSSLEKLEEDEKRESGKLDYYINMLPAKRKAKELKDLE